MKLLAIAVVTAGLCIASAIADAAPAGSATSSSDRGFWSIAATIGLGLFLSRLFRRSSSS